MRWLVVLAVLLLAGCSTEPGVACTEIGASPGVGVTIERETALGVTGLTLRVCHDTTTCADVEVQLSPGSQAIPSPCPTEGGPDTSCSASASPDGTLVGFAVVEDLPAGPITVSGTISRDSMATKLAAAEANAIVVYPNGPGCSGEANQAQIVIDENGIQPV